MKILYIILLIVVFTKKSNSFCKDDKYDNYCSIYKNFTCSECEEGGYIQKQEIVSDIPTTIYCYCCNNKEVFTFHERKYRFTCPKHETISKY